MKYVKFLIYALIIFVAVVLLVQNHEAFNTKVIFRADLLFGKYESSEISIYIISAVSFILGLIITWVFFLLERLQLRKQIKRLKNESREKDEELNSLRNLPIISESMTPGDQENDLELT